jgi:hypothetical protein
MAYSCWSWNYNVEFATNAVTLCMASIHAPVGASVIVSKLSDRLNRARGDESIRSVSARAAKLGQVGESTLHPYFRDGHPRPTMPVVVALALALKIPSDELRELAGIPAEGQPWIPPAESRLMNDRQRRAVTELIRSFVQTRGAGHAVPTDSSLSPEAAGAAPQAAEEIKPDLDSVPDRDRPGADESVTTEQTTPHSSAAEAPGDVVLAKPAAASKIPRGFIADQVNDTWIDESALDEAHGAISIEGQTTL